MKALIPNIPTVLLLLATMSFSTQSQTNESDTSQNSLQPGKWAIQFRIDRDFTLLTFQGTTISTKYHLNRTEALRVGVSVSFNFIDHTGLNASQLDTVSSGMSNSGDDNGVSIDLRAQYLCYPNPDDEVNLFLGAGPLVRFSRMSASRTEAGTTPSFSSRSTITDTRNSWAIGVSGLAGVEWFATRWLSLHAEYGLAIQYVWSKQTNERLAAQSAPPYSIHSSSEGKEKGWQLYYSSVNFGLSIYF